MHPESSRTAEGFQLFTQLKNDRGDSWAKKQTTFVAGNWERFQEYSVLSLTAHIPLSCPGAWCSDTKPREQRAALEEALWRKRRSAERQQNSASPLPPHLLIRCHVTEGTETTRLLQTHPADRNEQAQSHNSNQRTRLTGFTLTKTDWCRLFVIRLYR